MDVLNQEVCPLSQINEFNEGYNLLVKNSINLLYLLLVLDSLLLTLSMHIYTMKLLFILAKNLILGFVRCVGHMFTISKDRQVSSKGGGGAFLAMNIFPLHLHTFYKQVEMIAKF